MNALNAWILPPRANHVRNSGRLIWWRDLARDEISQSHHADYAHVLIFQVMLVPDLACFIDRLMLKAIVRLCCHNPTNKRCLRIMAEAGRFPLRILTFHSPDEAITGGNR